VPSPYARLIVGARRFRVLTLGNINSDATGIDMTPLFFVVILFLIFQKIDKCWRSAILPVAIVWGVIVVLSTKILSLFR